MFQLNCNLNGVDHSYVANDLEKLREIFLDLISFEKVGGIPGPFFFNQFSLFEINEFDVQEKFLNKE